MLSSTGSSIPAVSVPSESGRFIRRLNRFVVELELDQRLTTASLPNPGRLAEVLLPGAELGLVPGPESGRHPWRVMNAILPSGETVFLDTGRTNHVARYLLEEKRIPALAHYRVERAEAPLPDTRSRVDFLLTPEDGYGDEESIRYLEVKSCTLFNGRFAMFPDAVTERGRRHVEELSETGRGAVLIVVHSDRCDHFVPDFHTDLAFARTLFEARDTLPIVPVGVGWNADGSMRSVRTDMQIPWAAVTPHLADTGSYLILLRLPSSPESSSGDRPVLVGALGERLFAPGWYLYVGSAAGGLQSRINRHRRVRRKKLHWHIDYLREQCTWAEAFPVREPDRREAEIAAAVAEIADGSVPGFGASDSALDSHLFYFRDDPRRSPAFIDLVLTQRRAGLEQRIAPRSGTTLPQE